MGECVPVCLYQLKTRSCILDRLETSERRSAKAEEQVTAVRPGKEQSKIHEDSNRQSYRVKTVKDNRIKGLALRVHGQGP